MIESVNTLMEGDSPVCHFHSKLMQKEPKVGGAWEWHQDYGYWYKNEFLFPEQMMSVMIAITDANDRPRAVLARRHRHQQQQGQEQRPEGREAPGTRWGGIVEISYDAAFLRQGG